MADDWRTQLIAPGKPTELVRALIAAIERVLLADQFLLDEAAHERSVAHSLAVYLEPYFPGWNVACEYNREQDSKQDKRNSKQLASTGHLCLPDIVVHQRGTENNLLAIDVKTWPCSSERAATDQNKLTDYSGSPHKYRHVLHLQFNKGGSVVANWGPFPKS